MLPLIYSLFFLFTMSFFVVIFSNKGYAITNYHTRINVAGKVQLAIIRFLLPYFGGVSRFLRLPALPVKTIIKQSIVTSMGMANITLYYPEITSQVILLPVYFNFHGGGFVYGYAKQDDKICRYLANKISCLVINVDYVLAPTHPFPAAISQSYEVIKWVYDHAMQYNIDSNRIALGGQSAGASIATAICLLAKEKKEFVIKLQILNYGWFDLVESLEDKYVHKGIKQTVTSHQLNFFKYLYLSNIEDGKDRLASPLLVEDLSQLPTALIIIPSKDVLKLDSTRYAEKLRNAGVSVICEEFQDADHAFTYFGPRKSALASWDLMVSTLQQAFNLKIR